MECVSTENITLSPFIIVKNTYSKNYITRTHYTKNSFFSCLVIRRENYNRKVVIKNENSE